jgi:hypothetical protein
MFRFLLRPVDFWCILTQRVLRISRWHNARAPELMSSTRTIHLGEFWASVSHSLHPLPLHVKNLTYCSQRSVVFLVVCCQMTCLIVSTFGLTFGASADDAFTLIISSPQEALYRD